MFNRSATPLINKPFYKQGTEAPCKKMLKFAIAGLNLCIVYQFLENNSEEMSGVWNLIYVGFQHFTVAFHSQHLFVILKKFPEFLQT